jgi:cytochrome b561
MRRLGFESRMEKNKTFRRVVMTQYSKRMVIVHWLTLALLIAAWFWGNALDGARHDGNATLTGYLMHALVGGVILLLTLARLYFRRKDGTPPATGNTLMDKVATGIHHAFYSLLVLLPVSGVAIIASSDVGKALLAGDATLLPQKFSSVPAHNLHEVLVTVLIVLVVVHVLGAIKHQFIIKDGLMSRMSLCRDRSCKKD